MNKLILGYEHIDYNLYKQQKRIIIPNSLSISEAKLYQYIDVVKFNNQKIECFRTELLYHEFENFFIERKLLHDIPEDKNYFYPIHIELQEFWGSNYLNIPLKIPSKVINDIRKKKCKILFSMIREGEGFSNRTNSTKVLLLKNQIQFNNLENDDIVYVDANLKTPEVLRQHDLIGFYYNKWEKENEIDGETHIHIVNDIKLKKLRPKKSICFNLKPRAHRIELVHKLLNEHLHDEMILSCLKLGINYDYSKHNVTNPTKIKLNAHLQCYFNIVTETFFNYDETRLLFGEKVFKPIVCFQPFILVGQVNSLKHLTDLGYKSFTPWINESYDGIVNDSERLECIVSEIKRLHQLTSQQWSEMLYEMLPILEHNYNLLNQNKTSQIKEKELISSLENLFNK